MQQDVAFGVRQLVDIALKAISPAVNDPSTAATCIDRLGSLLAEIARRRTGPRVILRDGAVLVVAPQPSFVALVDRWAQGAFNMSSVIRLCTQIPRSRVFMAGGSRFQWSLALGRLLRLQAMTNDFSAHSGIALQL